jgi:drug/metabolite transporter (DMT)-like permease
MTDKASAASAPASSAAPREGIAHVMMLVAVLIFAVNYVIGRWAAGDTPPYTLGFVRWTSGMLILLPFAWSHLRDDRDFIRRNWKLLCLAGFLMPFMGAGVTYVALTYTGAINGGVIQTSMPVMIVLLSWMFLKERTTGIQWLGIVVAISGVLYIVARGNPSSLLDLSFNIGDAILIGCNLGLAGYGVAVRKLPAGIHSLSLITVVCAVGALCHVPFFAYEMASGVQIVLSPKTFVSLAFVAIFPSVVAILLWNSAIGRIGPSRAGVYMYLTPVYAAIFAIPLLGESIGVYHVVGGVLIIIGVTLSSRKTKAASG